MTPETPHDSPYPGANNLAYRIAELERWKDHIEREGIARTLAVQSERMDVMRGEVDRLKDRQRESEAFMAAVRGGTDKMKNTIIWVMAVVAILGLLAPYLFGGVGLA